MIIIIFRSKTFCKIVEKIHRSCADQTKHTLENIYPNVCSAVNTAVSNNWCRNDEETFRPNNNIWTDTEIENFKKIILKYTKENIMKINIFIKDPFAIKYKIVENASM